MEFAVVALLEEVGPTLIHDRINKKDWFLRTNRFCLSSKERPHKTVIRFGANKRQFYIQPHFSHEYEDFLFNPESALS